MALPLLPLLCACHFCPLGRVIEFSGSTSRGSSSISISARALYWWITANQWIQSQSQSGNRKLVQNHRRLRPLPLVTIDQSSRRSDQAQNSLHCDHLHHDRRKFPYFFQQQQQYYCFRQSWIHATATPGAHPLPPAPVASRANGSRRSARWSSPPSAVAGK